MHKKLSFIFYLTTITLLNFLVILGVSNYFSYQFHKKTTMDLTHVWTAQISNTIFHKTNFFLRPAEISVELIADLVQQSNYKHIENNDLQHLLRSVLLKYSQFRSCCRYLEKKKSF